MSSDLARKVIPRDEHSVSRKLISENALKVIHRLNEHGYEAYLVGGGVRDILLGGHPKDFDVSTDAHPEQVHALFRNSRLIGRRFKIVHILFGREIIEVATFRGPAEQTDDANKSKTKSNAQQHKQSEQGMLLRDNVYGTLEDDVLRRDFTANALYYSPKDFCVYDFVGGVDDLKAGQLKLIGDPEQRYREDPVRMLRALRFKSKLGFEIEERAEQAIHAHAELIEQVAPARLFDEIIKLFVSGYGANIFTDLDRSGLFASLFPSVAHTLKNASRADYYRRLIKAGLNNTDKRIQADKPVTPGFLYAVLLWPEVDRLWQQYQDEGLPEFPALQTAGHQALQAQLPYITIPKRFSLMMKEIWELQIRLKKTRGRWPKQLLTHKRFRAGYDFLLLREQAGEDLNNLGQWWTQFQAQHPDLVNQARKSDRPASQKPKRRPNHRKRRPQN